MERWEYLLEIKNPRVSVGLEHRLNELGAQGWELISLAPLLFGKEGTVSIPAGSSTTDYMGVFKRKVGRSESREARFG